MKKTGPVRIEHGSGGALSRELVEELVYPALKTDAYPELLDASAVEPGSDLLLTTDGYVVDPPFFPGGDIGKLAVYGTCNDLAVSGARPLSLALGMIIEEGFALSDLKRVVDSVAEASASVGVRVVTGDTKVVPRGKGGGIFVTSTGVGRRLFPHTLSPSRVREGDSVLVSGPLGSHGLAILAARESLPVGPNLRSDAAPLFPLCQALYGLGEELRFLRDATRGGVAAILNEIASSAPWGIETEENAFPVTPDVKAAADILGLNPLEIANEGVLVAVVSERAKDRALELLHAFATGKQAACVGLVAATSPGTVTVTTSIGGKRILDFPRGLLLPRIC